MRYKVLESIDKFIFDSIYKIGMDKKIAAVLGDEALDLKL